MVAIVVAIFQYILFCIWGNIHDYTDHMDHVCICAVGRYAGRRQLREHILSHFARGARYPSDICTGHCAHWRFVGHYPSRIVVDTGAQHHLHVTTAKVGIDIGRDNRTYIVRRTNNNNLISLHLSHLVRQQTMWVQSILHRNLCARHSHIPQLIYFFGWWMHWMCRLLVLKIFIHKKWNVIWLSIEL